MYEFVSVSFGVCAKLCVCQAGIGKRAFCMHIVGIFHYSISRVSVFYYQK